MPKAWNAGWLWVSFSRKLDASLSTSKPTPPRSAPCHSARRGVRGWASNRNST